MGVYVYGFVRRADLAGEGVVEGDLAALVKRVEGDRAELRHEAVVEHAGVLEAALDRGPVLPARFGHVMPDEAAVRAHIAGRAADMERLLGELQGRVEMDLTAVYREGPLLREVLAENPSLAAARRLIRGRRNGASQSERIRLGEAIVHEIDRKREADSTAILRELESAAVAVTTQGPRHARMLLNAAFLVERNRLDEFAELFERLRSEQAERMELRLVGPRPAGSFVG